MLSAQLIVVSSHSVWEKEGFRPLLQMSMLPCYMGERLFHKSTALWGATDSSAPQRPASKATKDTKYKIISKRKMISL